MRHDSRHRVLSWVATAVGPIVTRVATNDGPRLSQTCPRVGDYIAAECGYRLKVVAITHKVHPRESDGRRTPYVEVELHR